jgi:hypothetical protein
MTHHEEDFFLLLELENLLFLSKQVKLLLESLIAIGQHPVDPTIMSIIFCSK